MPAPVSEPKLKNVTTNKLYPAYATEKGTVIQMNGLKTLLPTGATLNALVKFVDGSGLDTVIVTGGKEKKGHSVGSFHGLDLAIDIAGTRFNNLTNEQARKAALDAGFTHGVYEDFKNTGRDHWHFQIGAGNGLGDKNALKNSPLSVKHY